MIQPSALNLLIVGAMVTIWAFMWRSLATRLADTSWGQAMAYIL